VISVSARDSAALFAGPDLNRFFRGSSNAVRIRQHKMALVLGIGLEVENAPGKHIRRCVLEQWKTRGGSPINSCCSRIIGSQSCHRVSPVFRNFTSTCPVRLSSRVIRHSKPSETSVAGSIANSPDIVLFCAFEAGAQRSGSPAIAALMANKWKFLVSCAPDELLVADSFQHHMVFANL
jgi:hypothetical protein